MIVNGKLYKYVTNIPVGRSGAKRHAWKNVITGKELGSNG